MSASDESLRAATDDEPSSANLISTAKEDGTAEGVLYTRVVE
jgi:hypothetical protein